MKVVFILPGSGLSGGVRVTVMMANLLMTRGHAVRILYRKPPNAIRNFYRLIRSRVKHQNHSWLDGFSGKLGQFQKVTDCSFDEGEIIIGVGMWASRELSQLRIISNPKIQYIHGATPWDEELMKNALCLPFSKIVVASYLKPVVKSYRGGDVAAVIHNAINRKEYFSSLDESERDGIGTIYSSHPAKDPETLLAVIRKLSLSRPHMPIRIFSADKRPRQIEKKAFWRFPTIEKAREIYSRSLVWVLASRSEGFPAPVLEAMACGCVVVATDCGGTRDMIADGVNGFLAEVGSVQRIVDRVLLVLGNESMRNRMRQAAEETVKKFNWDNSIDLLEKTLEKFEMGSVKNGKVFRKY